MMLLRFLSKNSPSSFFSSRVASIVFSYILVLACCNTNGGTTLVELPNNETVPAILVFGDSIVDPGNNNYIKTIVKCDFQPYGRDFVGKEPTGRFCNGKVPSDFIVEMFGIKELLPAYLDSNLGLQDLLTGVSFASGGCGYDPLTPKLVSVLSLTDQLNLFKEYVGKIESAVGEERAATILSKSIYVIVCGSDDIANTYFSTPTRRLQYDIDSYTDLTVDAASQFLQELYGVGARRIGVLSIPPIGCVPSQRTLGGGITRKCSEAANQAATLFNSKISSQIKSLKNRLPDSKIVYFDVYNPFLSLINNPSQYGFEVVNKGCCGTGNIEVSILCNRLSDPETCTDATKYVFWDSYHPTEKGYSILTPMIINKHVKEFF